MFLLMFLYHNLRSYKPNYNPNWKVLVFGYNYMSYPRRYKKEHHSGLHYNLNQCRWWLLVEILVVEFLF